MKRLYYLFLTLVSPAHNDEYNRLGEGEYLASHGVMSEDRPKMIQGEAIVRLSKHLQNI